VRSLTSAAASPLPAASRDRLSAAGRRLCRRSSCSRLRATRFYLVSSCFGGQPTRSALRSCAGSARTTCRRCRSPRAPRSRYIAFGSMNQRVLHHSSRSSTRPARCAAVARGRLRSRSGRRRREAALNGSRRRARGAITCHYKHQKHGSACDARPPASTPNTMPIVRARSSGDASTS
jgi:hypothetical protein